MHLVESGTPTTDYVEVWTGERVSVRLDAISQVRYYQLVATGFMQQQHSVLKTLIQLDVSCMYKGAGTITYTLYSDEDTFDIVCNCVDGVDWTKSSLTVPLNKFIRSIKIKVDALETFSVTHIYGVAQVSAEDTVQTTDNFIQKAILYGRDADKPNLREVNA